MAQVGFIGLGAIGVSFATHLQQNAKKDSQFIYVYNRTKGKTAPLVEIGAKAVDTVKEIAENCDILFSCVFNDEALEDIYQQVQPVFAKKPNAIYVDCSTVFPGLIDKLAQTSESSGFGFVSSPFFGRPEAAAKGAVVSLPSGPTKFVDQVSPYIKLYSRALVNVSEKTSSGVSLKLSGNFLIASLIESIGQANLLAEKNGVPEEAIKAVIELLLPGPVVAAYSGRLVESDFIIPASGGVPLSLAAKDIGHMRSLAQTSQCALPNLDIIYQHLTTLLAMGHSDLDWSALAAVNRINAGLPLSKK